MLKLCLMLETSWDTDMCQAIPVRGGRPPPQVPSKGMLFLAESKGPQGVAGFVFATSISKDVWLIMEEAFLHPHVSAADSPPNVRFEAVSHRVSFYVFIMKFGFCEAWQGLDNHESQLTEDRCVLPPGHHVYPTGNGHVASAKSSKSPIHFASPQNRSKSLVNR
jgi:hypothetical protein